MEMPNQAQAPQPPQNPSPQMPPSAPTPPPAAPTPPAPNISSDDQNKIILIIGYIFPFLFFLPLVMNGAKSNRFARFHANQQLILLLFWVIGQIAASVLTAVLIGLLLFPVVFIGGLVFMILGILNVVNNQMKPLPLIGGINIIK